MHQRVLVLPLLFSRPRRAKAWLAGLSLAVLVSAGHEPARAQAAASAPQRAITHADFDGWRTVATPVLSRDGKWLAYSFQPQDGDGELVIRELASGRERREPIGVLPPPSLAPNEENPDAPPTPRAIQLKFSSDSRFVVTTTYPSKAELAAARKARRKPEDGPNGLLVVALAGGPALRVADVKSMQVPTRGGAWVAYLKEEAKAEAPRSAAPGATAPAPAAASAAPAPSSAPSTAPSAAPSAVSTAGAPRTSVGTELVLRDLATGSERPFANVSEFSFARDGKTLVYAVSAKAETENGLYAVTPGAASQPVTLLAGKGRYLKTTWDREQTQLAFLSDRDDAGAKVPRFKVYHWQRGAATAGEAVSAATPGLPADMGVQEKGPAGTLAFTRDGRKLLVPVAPPAPAPKPADAAPAPEDKVTADLWRWNDEVVQPMQKVRAVQERNRSYRGVLDLATRRYTQLADATLRNVALSDDGLRALGSDERPYGRSVDHDGRYVDLYVVDPATGQRRLALRKLRDNGQGSGGLLATARWSPDGQWLAYYQDRHWQVLDTARGSSRRLTGSLGVPVDDEQHDLPAPASAYGVAGWTRDSSALVVYDRYDVWQVFVDGRRPVNLTQGEGRRAKLQFRVERTDPAEEDDDERGLNLERPLVLRGVSETTRASGFFQTAPAGAGAQAAPRRLQWDDANLRYVGRAQEADVLLVASSRFDRYPDLHTTSAGFEALTKVTDGGAQMAPFLWGRSELMPFTSARGVKLQAGLYKPANFDPKKKYPLIVYIYERLSQNVHNFVNPAPGQNINFAQYTSNGYLVLTPDIVYTTGQPGRSAMDAVMPAVATLVKQGYVDEKAIGIQGHSWGGYQIAYMVTQTDRFRAAEAGAPVGNMTSAYSGIRWGSGLPRQFQYEQTQSRLGKPLTEAPGLYIANSPVFQVTKVKTPLLILHNDNDDAVPWQQGIELFLALRRHGKEAYFLNYNGEFHGLRRRADQKDYARRMNQFFDHFLKGAPAPEWMDKGIPYIDRDEEKERYGAVPPASKAVAGAD